MKIASAMNINPVRIRESATLKDAAELAASTHVSDLMVVDDQGRFAGVLSEGDLIRHLLPNYDDLVRDGTLVTKAFEVFLAKGKESAVKPITPLVIKKPITFTGSDELLRAATTMITKHIRLLPVVENGVLIGTISRGDLCKALLSGG